MFNSNFFDTMTQFTTLSVEAQNVITNFCESVRRKGMFDYPSLMLGASLYAMRSDAKPNVVEKLDEYILDLNAYLADNEIETLQAEYNSVITTCFYYDDRSDMSSRPFYKTPLSVVDLCLRLTNIKADSNVYLPYSGMGEYSHRLQGSKCKGFEIDNQRWAFSEIANNACGVDCDIDCSGQGTISSDDKFDYILTCPPFDIIRVVANDITRMLTNNLNKDGQLCIVGPMMMCFDNINYIHDFRKALADINASITVLTLSEKTFKPYTGISTVMICVKNDGLGRVVLSDFTNSDYIINNPGNGRRSYSLNVDAILESLATGDKQSVWNGTYSDLTDNLDISPRRYLPVDNMPELKEGGRLVPLGELIEKLPTTKLGNKTLRPLIDNRNLSDNYLNCNISAAGKYSNVQETVSVIDKNCILISCISGKIKVGKLTDASYVNSVTLRGEVYAVSISSDIITEDYLLRSLLSNYVIEQSEKYTYGAVARRMSYRDFCRLQIIVPSLEEQERLCYDDAHKGIKEADDKLRDAYEDYRRDVHMKKHAIGQTLFNLNNWWNVLNQAKEMNNGIIDENAVIGRNRKIAVRDILENIGTAMSKLNIQLNKFDTGYGLVKEQIALTQFIEEYIEDNKSPLFRYEYNAHDHRSMDDIPEVAVSEDHHHAYLTGSKVVEKGEPLEYIKFPKEALTTIFNNIVSNACAHGFANRKDRQNIIKIDINSVGTDYVVTISNNGEPLDSNMKCEDITVYGHTSGDTATHFGIGGYEIKRLMEEFGDEVEIVSSPDEEFTMSYKLIFHDTNIVFA